MPLSEQDKSDLRLARLLEPMMRSEAWRVYSDILKAHEDYLLSRMLAPAVDLLDLVRSESQKGVITGMRDARTRIAVIVENASEIRARLKPEESQDAD
jgi:hypothetical protein